MTHTNNRARISIDLEDDWRKYTVLLPNDSVILGVATVGDLTGALIKLQTSSGLYKLVVHASVKPLKNDRKVEIALAAARAGKRGGRLGGGRRAVDGVVGMTRTNISIDVLSKEILREYGGGDLSLGIRKAALLIEMQKK